MEVSNDHQVAATLDQRPRSLPEAGAGYQVVDVLLLDDEAPRGALVLNGRELLTAEKQELTTRSIAEIRTRE